LLALLSSFGWTEEWVYFFPLYLLLTYLHSHVASLTWTSFSISLGYEPGSNVLTPNLILIMLWELKTDVPFNGPHNHCRQCDYSYWEGQLSVIDLECQENSPHAVVLVGLQWWPTPILGSAQTAQFTTDPWPTNTSCYPSLTYCDCLLFFTACLSGPSPPVHSWCISTPVHQLWWLCDLTFPWLGHLVTWPFPHGHPSFVLVPLFSHGVWFIYIVPPIVVSAPQWIPPSSALSPSPSSPVKSSSVPLVLLYPISSCHISIFVLVSSHLVSSCHNYAVQFLFVPYHPY